MMTHFTEYAGIAAILGALEANLSIICACLPAFPSLLTPLLEKLKSSLGSGKHGSLRALFYGFSSRRTRPHARGSLKLTSSTEALGPEHLFVARDLESAKHTPKNIDHTDKLYPLSVTSASRTSVERGSECENRGQVHVQTRISAETVELARLGGRMETWGNVRC